MASTCKAARRAGGCICPENWKKITSGGHGYRDTRCKYGYCYSARCNTCGGEVWGTGPVVCPCDGVPRWVRHRGMAQPGRWQAVIDKLTGKQDMEFVPAHAALKPSSKKFKKSGLTSRRSRA